MGLITLTSLKYQKRGSYVPKWKTLWYLQRITYICVDVQIMRRKFNQDLLQKTKNFVHWMILYVLPEVYEAMGCVVVECINISNMNLFVSNYGKSMHLSEFESQQQTETSTVIKYLKETWLEKITQSVKLCLRDIGKEWFDLEQKNHDVYNVMKLKRFMDLIVYRMQVL